MIQAKSINENKWRIVMEISNERERKRQIGRQIDRWMEWERTIAKEQAV